MSDKTFAQRMRAHQRRWLLGRQGTVADLDSADRAESWVLNKGSEKLNLYKPEWWEHIAGKEHPWVRSLNSSQCFAVNLFGPLAENAELAKRVMQRLWPSRSDHLHESVTIRFEQTPDEAPRWLGEQRQPTQVDVLVTTLRKGSPLGCLLIEVKLTETHFGACRGAKPASKKREGNPRPERCLDLPTILADPTRQCWLVEAHKRKYWTLIRGAGSSFSLERLTGRTACPFRGGLYQLMRNRVLADQLVSRGKFAWADVAACVHQGNHTAKKLEEPVAGQSDVVAAFNAIVPQAPILEIDPRRIVRAVREASTDWVDWADTLESRYWLDG